MPMPLTNHASIAEMPVLQAPDRSTDTLVDKMDGVLRRTGNAITSAATDNKDSRDGRHPGNGAVVKTEAEAAAAGQPREKQKPNKHSVDYMTRSFVAGGIAGCAAKTTVAPLDRVKILFQTSNPQFAKYTGSWSGLSHALSDIYAQHGIVGLFRGHSATLLKIYPYAAIKFVAYEQYRAFIIGAKHQETWLRRFTAGALAGVTSVLFTYPLEVIRVRLAFETGVRPSSLTDICTKIYHEHPLPKKAPAAAHASSAVVRGLAGAATTTAHVVVPRSGIINFYRGFSTTMLGMVPYAGMSFLTHDSIGDVFRSPLLRKHATLPRPANAPSDKPAPLQAWAELTAGGISGAVSQTISYPLELIRRRMQVAGAVGDGHRLRIAETAGMIFKERGFSGFFVGLSIGYIKIIPLAAVSFYTYERTKTMLGI
ncbi:mitochondrial carrier domain-containing protein [Astrocystis sublimbata]|nr:mitochondrial carrier domain-containing protein [Astrocystis sublimbata]